MALVKLVTEEETVFAHNLVKEKYSIYNDEVKHLEWYLIAEHPKGNDMNQRAGQFKKSQKLHKRLIIFTKHRLLFVKRAKLTKKLVLHFTESLFNLLRMENGTPNLVLMQFADQTQFVLESGLAPEFIRRVRSLYGNITNDWDDDAKMKLDMDTTKLLPMTLDPPSIGKGVLDVYYAKCSQAKKEPSMNFILYMQDLAEVGLDEFILSDCPGVYATSSSSQTQATMSLRPVIAALDHSTYFYGLTVKDVPRPDMFEAIQSLLRYNKTMTKLVLSGLSNTIMRGHQETIATAGRSLAANRYHSVMVLDLSYTRLSVSATFGFVDALDAWPHALRVLNLSHCQLKKVAVAEVFNAFSRNLGMSLTLEELVMDENEFDKVGSDAMSLWLNKVKDKTPLRKFSLSGCKLDGHQAFHGFTLNAMRLEYLNLSKNKLPANVARDDIAPVAYSSATLNQLYLSDCQLDAESAMRVLINIASNERLNHVVCDLSDNDIGKKALNGLKGIFVKDSGVQNIRHLDISGNDLYPTHLPEVLVAMRKSNVQVLSIGKRRNSPCDDDAVLEALRDNVLPRLRVLKLQGNSKSPEILMRALQENTSVVELDLSDYGLGDAGALLLGLVLRYNSTIQSVSFDHNGIMMNGYMAIRDGLRKNMVVKWVGYPFTDVKQLQKSLDITQLAVLRGIWMDVEVFVRRNGGGWGNSTYRQFELVGRTEPDDYRKYPCPRSADPHAFVPEDMERLPKPKAYRDLKGKDKELLEAEDAWKQDRVDRGLEPEESRWGRGSKRTSGSSANISVSGSSSPAGSRRNTQGNIGGIDGGGGSVQNFPIQSPTDNFNNSNFGGGGGGGGGFDMDDAPPPPPPDMDDAPPPPPPDDDY